MEVLFKLRRLIEWDHGKFVKIVELIRNIHRNTRAAKVLLPKKNIVARLRNLLYPLECEIEENIKTRHHMVRGEKKKGDNQKESPINRRELRKPAVYARNRIVEQMLVAN